MPNTTIETDVFSIEHLKSCKGYDPKFIDGITAITLDVLNQKQQKNLPKVSGDMKGILKYSRFSVLYSKPRKLPFVSAANIDGNLKVQLERKGNFQTDPRIESSIQLDDKFYDLIKGGETEFDIGHMTSNNEMCWSDEARTFASETFHFPNSVPQAPKLNRGLWSSLESYILDEAKAKKRNQKICVFTGPVLDINDPLYVKNETFQVPLMFWKVVVFKKKDGIYTTAFVMSHEKRLREMNLVKDKKKKLIRDVTAPDDEEAFLDFPYKKVFQVNLELVEKLTGHKFKWSKVKRVAVPDDKLQLKTITATATSDEAKAVSRDARRRGVKAVKRTVAKMNMVL
ncbi:MAG: DNA/RNA non-specific endonuclease [Bacteroidetes bacterium]|nr:DNA/RNA non-specific endonuclease [Bacteroidota bacterium]